jgi:hypothetical protein
MSLQWIRQLITNRELSSCTRGFQDSTSAHSFWPYVICPISDSVMLMTLAGIFRESVPECSSEYYRGLKSSAGGMSLMLAASALLLALFAWTEVVRPTEF